MMKIKIKEISESLHKVFSQETPQKEHFDNFKLSLQNFLGNIDENESEENLKNNLILFLNSYYNQDFHINTKERADLVIHTDNTSKSSVGVLFEIKHPANKSQMITGDDINCKGLQQLVLYFLRERINKKNIDIKHLILTNIYDWYIFEASEFERIFNKNNELVKQFNEWQSGQKISENTELFYNEIAKPFIDNSNETLSFTYFNLKDFVNQSDSKLISLYKVLSPHHLLKLSLKNDSNTLNTEFYNELLHILGLHETKVKNVKRIERLPSKERQEGSLIENTINILQSDEILLTIDDPKQFGDTTDEQLFSIGLELCIIWLNRILFLKLLESQLVKYNQSNKEYQFFNSTKIQDFDKLRELFFEVLAIKPNERTNTLQEKYPYIPYLNSSLFEQNEIERETVKINQLKSHLKIPIFGATVLKDKKGKRIVGTQNILEYLFDFLESYNFSSDHKAEIQQANKTIINSAVLGLIFEKINGYKDGSHFTPGFITMYMSREILRKAVIQKFRSSNLQGFQNLESLTDLYNQIHKIGIAKANEIFNTLKVCDPSVGSGHFLVSALNELIAIKSELGILADKNGKILRDVNIEVIDDELYISIDSEIFTYNYKNTESQRIQETLFHEKQTIIENCLFGVDINPKSVNISQLRLWIELLKNTYYIRRDVPSRDVPPCTSLRELQTLPNIDINIKAGNSLISHFSLNGNSNGKKQSMKAFTKKYKQVVADYKNTTDRTAKRSLERFIKEQKENFARTVNPSDEDLRQIRKITAEMLATPMFFSRDDQIQWQLKFKQLETELQELQKKYDEKLKTVYNHAFEWRFEFPEVLNDDGQFVGFDVVIGNPPYIRQEKIKNIKTYLGEHYRVYNSMSDILTYFIELSYNIIKENGHFSFIISNKFAKADYGKNLRNFLLDNTTLLEYIDLSQISVFDKATVDTCVLSYTKEKATNSSFSFAVIENKTEEDINSGFKNISYISLKQNSLTENSWTFVNETIQQLIQKIEQKGTLLEKWNIKINFGIKTGLNDVFIIDEKTKNNLIQKDSKNAELINPLLRGRDIKKYHFNFQNLWLISLFPSENINIDNYPIVKNYLGKFKKRLQQTGKINSRKKTSNKWYETQDNVAYWKNYLKNKIIYPEFSTENSFAWDKGVYYGLDTTWIISGTECNKYLLGLLNSRLAWFYLKQIVSVLGTQAFRMKKTYLERLPLVKTSKTNQNLIIKLVDKILKQKEKDPSANTSKLEKQIDNEVYKLYNLTAAEIKIIESH